MTTLIGWFTGLETQGKAVAILIGIGLAVIAIATAVHFVNAAFEIAEDKGAVVERAEAQGKVIENVKAAKDAGTRYRADPAQRDAGCLLDATAPDDC